MVFRLTRYTSIRCKVIGLQGKFSTWISATDNRRLGLRVALDVMTAGIADSAMTLAAQSFTSLLPVIIAFGIFDSLQPIAATVLNTYGLDLSALGAGSSSSAAFGIAGMLMLVVSATSYARALGRMYARTWLVPISPARQAWRWMAVVVLIAIAVASSLWCTSITDENLLGTLLELSSVFLIWALAWSAVPRLLTGGRAERRMLVAYAVLTASGLTVLHGLSTIFLPPMARSSAEQFGLLGVMFTFVGWLFAYSMIVVSAACISNSLFRDPGSFGSWLRARPLAEGEEPERAAELR